MGSLGNFAEDALLDHIFNSAFTPDATVYIGLSTADPLDDASGIAEPGGGSYAREECAFDAAAARKVENSGLITFTQATGAWGTISHWFICDHLSNTNFGTDVELLAHGSFAVSKVIATGNTASVAAQEIDIEITAGGIATAVVHKLLDLMFRNQAYSAPDTYIGVVTVNATDSMTGSTITEPSGNNYSRTQVQTSGWNTSSGGSVTNNGVIQLPTPSGAWGTITDAVILSAAANGDLIAYGDLGGDEDPTTDDDVEFADTVLSISLS
jgi:hypothetical protein